MEFMEDTFPQPVLVEKVGCKKFFFIRHRFRHDVFSSKTPAKIVGQVSNMIYDE